MKTLIKKDIQLVGWNNLIVLMLGLLLGTFSLTSYESEAPIFAIFWGSIMMIYIILTTLISEDRKTKDIILKSLPLDRKDIVLSRYMTMLIYLIFIYGIIYLTSQIYSYAEGLFAIGKPITISSIIFILVIAINLISIVIPIQYISIKVGKTLNILIYGLLILFPLMINRLDDAKLSKIVNSINNIRFMINPIIYILFGSVIYFISFLISTKLYKSIDR